MRSAHEQEPLLLTEVKARSPDSTTSLIDNYSFNILKDNLRKRVIMAAIAVSGLGLAIPSQRTASASQESQTKIIGVVEDLRDPSTDYLKARLDMIRQLGANAVGYDTTWQEGQAEAISEVKILEAPVKEAIARGMEPIIRFYPCFSRDTTDAMKCHYPFRPSGEKMFVTALSNLAKGLPDVRRWVIGNEPNSWRFLFPQYGEHNESLAPAVYTRLLIRSYDTLKEISPENQVICGALASVGYDNPGAKRESHSVIKFIEGMAVEYKRLGRKKPFCDVIDIHPYGETINESPTATHSNKTIAFSDLGKLKEAWNKAFSNTAQPINLPIFLLEYGIDTEIPADKKRLYTGSSGPRVSEIIQAKYYRQAVRMVRCNPDVSAMLLLHAIDEKDLSGWQSGVYYIDHSPKRSFNPVSQEITSPTNC